ncbi:MAG: sulfotransferase family 2 domain-containing protein, partial [Pseudomonadota bacterium]
VWFRVAKVGTVTTRKILRQSHHRLDVPMGLWLEFNVEDYQDYFKFAFARNPWDRMVSCWLEKVCKKNYFGLHENKLLEARNNFLYFLRWVESKDLNQADQHLRLQTALFPIEHLDFLGRMETFAKDMARVIERLEIEREEIPKLNTSPPRTHYRDYYNDETRDLVASFYAQDIELLGYEF